jgi:hypothetical protein
VHDSNQPFAGFQVLPIDIGKILYGFHTSFTPSTSMKGGTVAESES